MRPSFPRLGQWPTRVVILVAVIFSAPACVSFGTHLIEHAIPLGITRSGPGGLTAPGWLAWSVVYAAFHCTLATWLAMALAGATMAFGRINWLGRAMLTLLATLTYISMRDMTSILHSCWGEAPHFPWCIVCS
jgi:hypothetical protein